MNKKRLSQKVSAVALNVFYRKQVAPLIRPKLRFVHLPPKGKVISKAVVLNSNGFATIRYETGEARPQRGSLDLCRIYRLFSIEAMAFSTTLSTVKPNFSNNCFAGADAPNVDIATISPLSPAYLYQL